jgi:hypothetical protein
MEASLSERSHQAPLGSLRKEGPCPSSTLRASSVNAHRADRAVTDLPRPHEQATGPLFLPSRRLTVSVYLKQRNPSFSRATVTNMRFASWCLVAAVLMPLDCAHGQSTDDSLRVYAVHIIQDPPQSWTGYGIYLGRGLVITAAHVVGSASHTKPSVRIAGMDLPAKAIKEGSFERIDLTLLSIDEEKLPVSLRMRRMPLCEKAPWVGEPVIVAVPEGTARSRIISPQILSPALRIRFATLIGDVATTGNSGSGVFDAGNKCLLGIMSRKMQVPSSGEPGGVPRDIAKYFVPASAIAAFIPAKYPL